MHNQSRERRRYLTTACTALALLLGALLPLPTTPAPAAPLAAPGDIVEFPTPSVSTSLSAATRGITRGPAGTAENRIGRSTPSGSMTTFPVPFSPRYGYPDDITAGPDGYLWFTLSDALGRITPAGVATRFPTPPTDSGSVAGITAGPDGNLWFTHSGRATIGRMTPDGTISEFVLGRPADRIIAGPDGNLWFTLPQVEPDGQPRIGKITPAGAVSLLPLPTDFGIAIGLVFGSDGNLWLKGRTSRLARMTPAGDVIQFAVQVWGNESSRGITLGPDGNVWFTVHRFEYPPIITGDTQPRFYNAIGRITPSGAISLLPLVFEMVLTSPAGITAGPDGNLWFTDYGALGRVRPGATPDPTRTPISVTDAPIVATITLASGSAQEESTSAVIDPMINRIYVRRSGRDRLSPSASSSLIVIDGATNGTVTTLPLSGASSLSSGSDVAIDTVAHRIYAPALATGASGNQLEVIDGITNVRGTPIALPGTPVGRLLVNSLTHRVYVATNTGATISSVTVSVIDGLTGSIIGTLPDGDGSLDLNPMTNRLYRTRLAQDSPRLVALDIYDLAIDSLITTLPLDPAVDGRSVSVDAETNRVYIGSADRYLVLDGATGATLATWQVPYNGYFLNGRLVIVPGSNRLLAVATCSAFVALDKATGAILSTSFIGPTVPTPTVTVTPATRTATPTLTNTFTPTSTGTPTATAGLVPHPAPPSPPCLGNLAVNPITKRLYAVVSRGNLPVLDVSGLLGPTVSGTPTPSPQPTVAWTPTVTPTPVPPTPTPSDWITADAPRFIAPVRLLDTRTQPTGSGTGHFQAGETRRLPVAGQTVGSTTFPADVLGLLLNVIVVGGPSGGYVTVFPGNLTFVPNTSTVNPSAPIAHNFTAVGVSPPGQPYAGMIDVYASTPLDIILDVVGYFAPSNRTTPGPLVGNLRFVTPVRVLDTRPASPGSAAATIGVAANLMPAAAGPILGGQTRQYRLGGQTFRASADTVVAFPDTVTGILAHVTAIGGQGGGFVTLLPGDVAGVPGTSTLNPVVPISFNSSAIGVPSSGPERGSFKVYTSTDVDIVVDVLGYYSPLNDASVSAGTLTLVAPVRVLDTRIWGGGPIGYDGSGTKLISWGAFWPRSPQQSETRRYQIAGKAFPGGPIPAGIKGLLANVTIVQPAGPLGGFMTAFPGDVPDSGRPNVSTVNPSAPMFPSISASFWANGLPTGGPNAGQEAIYVLNPEGSASYAPLDVIVDVVGYFR